MVKKKEKEVDLPERLTDESDDAYEARCAEAKKPTPTKGAYKLWETARTGDAGQPKPHVIDAGDDFEAMRAEFLRLAGQNPQPDVQQYVLMDEDHTPLMAG